MGQRPDWDAYFMGLVRAVSERATCDRGRSGCVVVLNKRILCTGYVGSPIGFPHCDEVGHLFTSATDESGAASQHCVRTVHAEQNAIAQAARYGTALEGATFYCTMEPCRACAMLIANVGCTRVVCGAQYHKGEATRAIFEAASIELVVLDGTSTLYDPRPGLPATPQRAIGIGDYLDEELRERGMEADYQAGRCPNCYASLGNDRYGSGSLRDGVFCSLKCYSDFHYHRQPRRRA